MGVDHSAYIGPYVRVTEKVVQVKVDRCKGHDRPEDAPYCPKCGKSKSDRYTTTEQGPAPDGWEEDYKKGGKNSNFWDFLSSTSIMSGPEVETRGKERVRTYIYLPNRYHKEMNLPDIVGGKYSEEEVPFDELDIKGTTEKFMELFADELTHLKQWFEVEIKFGYVSWCS